MLKSLLTQNFRGIPNLELENLGRVNLIVGKNGVGKSSILEALYLYATGSSIAAIRNILSDRNEWLADSEGALDGGKLYSNGVSDRIIKIGPIDNPSQTLQIRFVAYKTALQENQNLGHIVLDASDIPADDDFRLGFEIREGNGSPRIQSLEFRGAIPRKDRKPPTPFIKSSGIDDGQLATWWDKVVLTDLEASVMEFLRVISPQIEGISVVGDPSPSLRLPGRVPVVKIRGRDEPMSFRSLGEGSSRFLGLSLGIANGKDGMLLVDEVENGVHYSVQQRLWTLMFGMAEKLNCQIFVTTHSWDCVRAFQAATDEYDADGPLLIRIERSGDDVAATSFDRHELTIAVQNDIEIR